MHVKSWDRCCWILVLASLLAVAECAVNVTTLAEVLLPGSDATNFDTSSILGQTIKSKPFSLTIVTNTSHALVSFNVSMAMDRIGWIAMGFGTEMKDSAMIVLWPTENDAEWFLSHRSATGHNQPYPYSETDDLSSIPYSFSISPSASSADSKSETIVSFIRPLVIPSSQEIYHVSSSEYLNLSRSARQRIVYAAGTDRPFGNEADSAQLTFHDIASGATTIDLGKVYIKQEPTGAQTGTNSSSTSDGTSANEEEGTESTEIIDETNSTIAWTKYDSLIFAHAAMAMITFLLVTPIAVLIARVGRIYSKWFKFHSGIQLGLTLPLSLIIVILGTSAVNSGASLHANDTHTIFGFVFFALICIQIGIGAASHKIALPSAGGGRSPVRILHMLLGILLLALSWWQIRTGLSKYSRTPRAAVVDAFFVIFVVLFTGIYLASLVLLIIARKRIYRNWATAIFGLGRETNPNLRKEANWAERYKMNDLIHVQIGDAEGKSGTVTGSTGEGFHRRRASCDVLPTNL